MERDMRGWRRWVLLGSCMLGCAGSAALGGGGAGAPRAHSATVLERSKGTTRSAPSDVGAAYAAFLEKYRELTYPELSKRLALRPAPEELTAFDTKGIAYY